MKCRTCPEFGTMNDSFNVLAEQTIEGTLNPNAFGRELAKFAW